MQPLAGMDGAEFGKKRKQLSFPVTIARALPEERSQLQALQERAERIAGGNPRLAEWLDKVLCEISADAVLQALEKTQAEFREDILAETLLGMLSAETRSALANGLVFEVSVPRSCFEAVCGSVGLDRAIALGVLEVFPGGEVRVPRILPLEMPEDEELAERAARELYRVWWEESESSTEEQDLEIHRLAMLGKVEEIAGNIADALAYHWRRKSRYREVVKLCRETMTDFKHLGVLTELAIAEKELGESETALQLHQQVLANCSSEDNHLKARTLHQMANIYVDRDEVNEAILRYRESLALYKQIGDVQGIAASLHQLAVIYTNQGKADKAIPLYQVSLVLYEQIDNMQGKAGVLHQMAVIYTHQGKADKAIARYRESLVIYEQIEDVQGKAITVANMAQLLAAGGDFETAIVHLQESLQILQHIGSPDVATVEKLLAGVIQTRQNNGD